MAADDPSYPIVEMFGYHWNAESPSAKAAFKSKQCRFAAVPCEKYLQYKFGYCSVQYAAAADGHESKVYAVCDHRLDGAPLQFVVDDHFRGAPATMVPEITLMKPKQSFDYVAFDPKNLEDIIAIETQAVDLRGGGVGPAFRAWEDDNIGEWRKYFSDEAARKDRKDTVAYGVNMANIYKRLGVSDRHIGATS